MATHLTVGVKSTATCFERQFDVIYQNNYLAVLRIDCPTNMQR